MYRIIVDYKAFMLDVNCSSSASSVGLLGRWEAGSEAARGVGAAGRSTGDFGGVVGGTVSSGWASGSASAAGAGDGARGSLSSCKSATGTFSDAAVEWVVATRSSVDAAGSRRTGGTLEDGVAIGARESSEFLDGPAPGSATEAACPTAADRGVGAGGRACSSSAVGDGPSRLGGAGRWAGVGCNTWSGTQPGAIRRMRS